MKKMNVKKMLAMMLSLCMLLCSLNIQVAFAEDAQLGGFYGTNLAIEKPSGTYTGKDLSDLKTPYTKGTGTSRGDTDDVVFFARPGASWSGEEYIELNLEYVSNVTAIHLSQLEFQSVTKCRIDYFDEADLKWKTAKTADIALGDSSGLTTVDITLDAAIKTARIRFYILSGNNNLLRLISLWAVGTALTTEKMGGNVLYGSTVTWNGDSNVHGGVIDGNFQYNGSECACTMPTEGNGELAFEWTDAKTIDFIELTHGQGWITQGIKSGYIEAKNTEGVYEKVCDIDMTPVFENATVNREYTELPYPVTTTGLKIVVTEAMGNVVSFTQVIATSAKRAKLEKSIYSTTFGLYDYRAEDGTRFYTNEISKLTGKKAPGESGYSDNYTMVLFENPANFERDFGEDYIEIGLNAPSDVKQVVLYTKANDEEQKPKAIRIDYLDHETQQWITAEDYMDVPLTDEETVYNFPKTVYADSIRVYVLDMYSEFHIFRLLGLFAVGAERAEKLNNGNVAYGTTTLWVSGAIAGQNGPTAFYDGKIGNYVEYENISVSSEKPLNIAFTIPNSEINRIEIISSMAAQGIKKGYIRYYDQGGFATGTAAWYDIGEFEFDLNNAQLGGYGYNPVKQVINLPYTVKTPFITIVVTETAHASILRINEIMLKKVDTAKTGYTVSDMIVNAEDKSNVTLTTDFAEFDGNGYEYDVYYAAYSEDGQLLKAVDVNPVDFRPFSSRKITGSLDLSGEIGNVKLKRFIWHIDDNEPVDGIDVKETTITLQ